MSHGHSAADHDAGSGSTGAGDVGTDSGQLGLLTGTTWWSRTILFIIGAGTSVALQLSTDQPQSAFQWLLLIIGGVGCGLLAMIGAQSLNRRLSDPKRLRGARGLPPRARWRVVRAAAVVLGLGAGAVFAGTEVWSRIDRLVNGCPVPTQLRVLTTVESVAPTQEVAAAFERWTAEADDGCRRVDVFVYAAAEGAVVNALAAGWGREALRDIGPRPDVWLPDSRLQVEAVRQSAAGRDSHLGPAQPIAWSPLVVAVPRSYLIEADGPDSDEVVEERASQVGDEGWPAVLDLVESHNGVLVRSDPDSSIVGAAATHAIYAQLVPAVDDPGAPPAGRSQAARDVELRIETAPLLRDGPGLLCRYAGQLGPAETVVPPAVVTTQQALERFRAEGCSALGRPPEVGPVAVYPSATPLLVHQFVQMRWPGAEPAGRQDDAARMLGEWLVAPDGQTALEASGLRSGAPELAAAGPSYADFEGDLTLSRLVRRPGRVVLAVDVSGSMDYLAGDGRTRFQVAVAGVDSSLALMRDEDEFGLLIFPDGPQGSGTRTAVPVGPRDELVDGRRRVEAVTAALGATSVGGNTPLYDAIVDGLTLAAESEYDSEPVRALVVLTDGVNTTGQRSAAEVIATAQSEQVRDKGVRVYVIAIGEASCHGEVVAAITRDTGNGCQQARVDDVGTALRNVFAAVWGGAP